MNQEQGSSNTMLLFIKSIAIGSLIGAVICAIFLVSIAGVMLSSDVGQGFIAPLTMVTASFGGLAAGFISARSCGRAGLPVGLTSSLILFVIVILLGTLIYNEPISTVCLIKMGLMSVCGILGGILGVRKVSKRKRY